MPAVTSADGTHIAFERAGDGPPVIIVDGATCDRSANRPLGAQLAPRPVDVAARATPPALVLCGGASPEWMIDVGRRIAEALPDARLGVLEGQGHNVAPEVLAPVLAEFLSEGVRPL